MSISLQPHVLQHVRLLLPPLSPGFCSSSCPLSCTGPGGSDSKESACNVGDTVSISGSGRSPGGRHGKPLQYSWLENSMEWGVWRATVHGVAKSQTWLRNYHFYFSHLIKLVLVIKDSVKQRYSIRHWLKPWAIRSHCLSLNSNVSVYQLCMLRKVS